MRTVSEKICPVDWIGTVKDWIFWYGYMIVIMFPAINTSCLFKKKTKNVTYGRLQKRMEKVEFSGRPTCLFKMFLARIIKS